MSLETCANCSTRYAVGLEACPHCRSMERTSGPAVEVPLWADTACSNTACPAAGVQRRVMLPQPTPGVVDLPQLLCARCGWALPLAWPGPDVESDGDPMSPKITRLGGASNKHDPENAAAAETDPTPEAAADQPEPADTDPDATAEEGGEEPSPGSSSSTSTEKPSDTPATSKPAPRKRTQAASRSTKARTESSSAGPADTSGPGTDAPTDDEAAG